MDQRAIIAALRGRPELTEMGRNYAPPPGNRGLNRAAARMVAGEVPVVAPSDADLEAVMRQLQAQADAGAYFDERERERAQEAMRELVGAVGDDVRVRPIEQRPGVMRAGGTGPRAGKGVLY